jgi:PEGA domain
VATAPKPLEPKEESHVTLRRVIEQRSSANKESAKPRRRYLVSVGPLLRSCLVSMRCHVMPLALSAFIMIAILEGLYILGAARMQPLDGATAAPPNLPSVSVVPAVPTVPAPQQAEPSEQGVTRSTPVSNTSRLVIRSEPSGAQVVVDGRSYGLTPATLENVVPGAHQIRLQRGGIEVRQTVRVEPGATVSLVAPLQSASSGDSGWLAVATPIEMDVFEDGVLLGTSRSHRIMLATGSHTLVLVNEAVGVRHTQQVRIEAAKVTQLKVELPQSSININATPWAEVWIDGEPIGETPIGNLPIAVGTHEVVFRHPALGEKTVSTLVKAGVSTRLSVDLRQPTTAGR